MDSINCFGDLPDEVLVEIFSYATMDSINSVSLVCYRFYKLSSNDLLWRQFSPPTSPVNKDFRKFFVNDQIVKKNLSRGKYKHTFLPPMIREPHKLKVHEFSNVLCAANKNGRVVVIEFTNRNRKTKTIRTKSLSYRNNPHFDQVKDILFPSNDENDPPFVLTGGVDGKVHQHDIRNLYPKHLNRTKRIPSVISTISTRSSVEFMRWNNPSQTGLFISSNDGKIRLHFKKKGSIVLSQKPRWILHTFQDHPQERLLNYRVDGRRKRILAHSYERVKVYDITRQRRNDPELHSFDIGNIGTITIFPNDENSALIGCSGRIIRIDVRENNDNVQTVFTPTTTRGNFNNVFSRIKFHPTNENVCYASGGMFLESIDFRRLGSPVGGGGGYNTKKILYPGGGSISNFFFDRLDGGELMMFTTSVMKQEVCIFRVSEEEGDDVKLVKKMDHIDCFGATVRDSKIFCCGRSNVNMIDFAFNKY